MISGCPIDSNLFYCMRHYAPELLLLGVLALVGVVGVLKYKADHSR